MIKVICGEKGTGKTKIMVDTANSLSVKSTGDIVFIDDSKQLIYDLKPRIRFINITDYPLSGAGELLGFLCGIIATDYDVDSIFIDRLVYILKQEAGLLEEFFVRLERISQELKVDFYLSVSAAGDKLPGFLKKYM